MTVLNAAPARNNLEREFFELTDIFCVNETEAEVTSGASVKSIDEAIETARKLIAMGCKKHVLMTLGSQGAVLVTRGSEDRPVHVAAPTVDAIDTTVTEKPSRRHHTRTILLIFKYCFNREPVTVSWDRWPIS